MRISANTQSNRDIQTHSSKCKHPRPHGHTETYTETHGPIFYTHPHIHTDSDAQTPIHTNINTQQRKH